MMNDDSRQFENELGYFRSEVDIAIQTLFAFLAVHRLARRDKRIGRALNKTPHFWKTTLHALQCTHFITLGRIFD